MCKKLIELAGNATQHFFMFFSFVLFFGVYVNRRTYMQTYNPPWWEGRVVLETPLPLDFFFVAVLRCFEKIIPVIDSLLCTLQDIR